MTSHPLVRCLQCGSIDILDLPQDSSSDDGEIDGYVEAGVGIGTIAESLALVDPHRVQRFLDVGCNYGFALDLGRHLYGWNVVGVEPSLAGERGARELKLDIRNQYLDEHSDVGTDYDLALASEVVEHVPDPLGFLRAIRERLSPRGYTVLTTPAAEIVDPANPEAEIVAAVSPGYHVFIASAKGLELLLRAAGFAYVRVERRHGTLHAVAGSIDPAIQGDVQPVSLDDLQGYYRAAARRAPRGSALATGMAVRYLRLRVARGAFRGIQRAVRSMLRHYRKRWDLDLRQPAIVLESIRAGTVPPWSLAGAAFALGMIELSVRNRPERAAVQFELAAVSAHGWRVIAQVADLDTLDMQFQGAYHRVLALARAGDSQAVTEALSIGDWLETQDGSRAVTLGTRECRIYAEIAARSRGAVDTELERRVREAAPQLAATETGEARIAGLDALFALALEYAQRGSTDEARARLVECQRLAASTEGAHSRLMVDQCETQLAGLVA
jgi:SAM-dependent methyltransferase